MCEEQDKDKQPPKEEQDRDKRPAKEQEGAWEKSIARAKAKRKGEHPDGRDPTRGAIQGTIAGMMSEEYDDEWGERATESPDDEDPAQ